MGASPDAILFYGYCLNEEDLRPWNLNIEDPVEWEDDEEYDGEDRFWRLLKETKGVERPISLNFIDSPYKSWEEWFEAVEKVKNDHNYCDVSSWGALEAGQVSFYVAVPDSIIRTDWEQPLLLLTSDGQWNFPKVSVPNPEWDQRLENFCEFMKIPTEHDLMTLGWWLVASHG